MFIAIADSVNGGSGQGTGSGGGGNRTAPVLQFLLTPQDRVPKSYQLAFTSESEFPFSVFIGETEYVINSTADTVSGQLTQEGVPVEASVSFGAQFQLNSERGTSTGINKIFRFDNLIVGRDAFRRTEDPDFSGVTTLPARILDDLTFCFAFATGLPSNIGLWDVSNVLMFDSMFNDVPESAMSDAFGQWTFGDSAIIGSATFENISDADLASCLVQWEANANQGSSVDFSFFPFGSDPRGGAGVRDLDETIYPDAKAAYDNLIANNSWNFGASINWFVPTPPLDDYPNAAAAYSVRLLRTAYSGSALRVRRNAAPFDEQDIGFTAGGDLDEAAIVAFGGSDVLLVSAWYDQSGQSNHATQITPGSQPQIYNGTAVVTENGQPALDFDGSANELEITTVFSSLGSSDPVSVFSVCRSVSQSNDAVAWNFSPDTSNFISAAFHFNGSAVFGGRYNPTAFFGGAYAQDQALITLIKGTTTSHDVYKDGVNFPSSQPTRGDLNKNRIGSLGGNRYLDGTVQEIICYAADQSINRPGIETNIMTYYNIP